MGLHPTSLTWSSSISSTTTTLITRSPHNNAPKQRLRFHVESLKRNSKPSSVGLLKDPKKDLSRILRTEAAIRGVENKAKSLSWKHKQKQLWPKAILEALDDAIKGCQWNTALKIFALLRKQHWYEPRCQTYAKLLMMLGKCRQPEEASLLFEIMLSEGLKPTVDVFTALVSAYGQSGRLDQAFSTVEDMKSVVYCKPDIYTYSILISCCAKLHRFDLIKSVLAEMSYLGIQCNSVTYNSIIDGYGKAGMFEHMENSLNDMIENGNCHPDVFTLNSFVGAYGNGGQIDKMEKWYDEFQLMGITPDLTTSNIMMKSYGKASMYKKMKSVMDFMEKRFFTPTIVTYNTVIEVFGKAGEIEKMDKHFSEMKHRGLKPNSITYCSLGNAYSRAGHIDKVDSVMRQVENSDVVLDTPFFNCIISAYGQAGDLKRMAELFVAMKERKCEPNSITFACMIQAYNTHGKTESAQKLENMMISAKDSLGNQDNPPPQNPAPKIPATTSAKPGNLAQVDELNLTQDAPTIDIDSSQPPQVPEQLQIHPAKTLGLRRKLHIKPKVTKSTNPTSEAVPTAPTVNPTPNPNAAAPTLPTANPPPNLSAATPNEGSRSMMFIPTPRLPIV